MSNLGPPASLVNAPIRPYRRFLTSTFHERFVHAAFLALLNALNNAFWLGLKKDLFWSWFPLGPAGLKAVLFFMSSLFLFILQVATLKVGRRTFTAPLDIVTSALLSRSTFQTFFWYIVSGWWFAEAYIWSSPDLAWIAHSTQGGPDVLNERPIFLRLYAVVLALACAANHIYHGSSFLTVPISRVPAKPTAKSNPPAAYAFPPVESQVQRRAILVLLRSAGLATATMLLTIPLNAFVLRWHLWKLHLLLAKPFFNLSRANARPVGPPPLGVHYLGQCFLAAFLMALTWQLTSSLLLAYLNQEPSKNGLPLSSSSKDPNGTLLNGLKAKRDVVKTFAFWELAIIAHKHKDRRKAIFEDIDRPMGPMWTRMSEVALSVLRDIDLRITGPQPSMSRPVASQSVQTLPHIVPELRGGPVFQPSPKLGTGEMLIASPLRRIGSSKNPWRPPIEGTTRAMETKLLEYAVPSPKDQQTSQTTLHRWITGARSGTGRSTSRTKSERINAAILGAPVCNAALILSVIDATTQMLVNSLSEDTFGKATPTVPDTVRTFSKTLVAIESFVTKTRQGEEVAIDEVDLIVDTLRANLKELLSAFRVYLLDVGLGIAELNQANKAVEPPQEEVARGSEEAGQQPVRRQLFVANAHKDSSSGRLRAASKREDGRGAERSNRAGFSKMYNGQEPRREMAQVK